MDQFEMLHKSLWSSIEGQGCERARLRAAKPRSRSGRGLSLGQSNRPEGETAADLRERLKWRFAVACELAHKQTAAAAGPSVAEDPGGLQKFAAATSMEDVEHAQINCFF